MTVFYCEELAYLLTYLAWLSTEGDLPHNLWIILCSFLPLRTVHRQLRRCFEMMTSSITSLPVQPPISTLTSRCMKRQLASTRSRPSKRRHRTSNDAKPPNGEPCGLLATNATKPQVSALLDSLLDNACSAKPPPVQQDEKKPAGKRQSWHCVEPNVEVGQPRKFKVRVSDVEVGRRKCSTRLCEMIASWFEASDNKLAMKLFGNRNALMKERLRQRAGNNWVIHPCSDFR